MTNAVTAISAYWADIVANRMGETGRAEEFRQPCPLRTCRSLARMDLGGDPRRCRISEFQVPRSIPRPLPATRVRCPKFDEPSTLASGGQPGHRAAWVDGAVNAALNQLLPGHPGQQPAPTCGRATTAIRPFRNVWRLSTFLKKVGRSTHGESTRSIGSTHGGAEVSCALVRTMAWHSALYSSVDVS